MGKDKRPRKPKTPARDNRAAGTNPSKGKARTNAETVLPARRPPAVVGTGVPQRDRPALERLLRLVRRAVGALLDFADAAAGEVTKRRRRRGGGD